MHGYTPTPCAAIPSPDMPPGMQCPPKSSSRHLVQGLEVFSSVRVIDDGMGEGNGNWNHWAGNMWDSSKLVPFPRWAGLKSLCNAKWGG